MAKTELQAAADELEQYGKEPGSDGGLLKSLGSLLGRLQKGRGAPVADEPEPELDEEEDDEPEEDDELDEEEDDEPELESEPEDDEPAPPVRKSYGDGDSVDERLLKSLLIDEDGDPSDIADVIEVTPILAQMVDVFAKSFGDLDARLQEGAHDRLRDRELIRALGLAVVRIGTSVMEMKKSLATVEQIGGSVDAMQKSLGEIEKQPASVPHPGVMMGLQRPLAGTPPPPAPETLSKSQAELGIRAAFGTGLIDQPAYTRAAGTLDAEGVEAALKLLPEHVVEVIRRGT